MDEQPSVSVPQPEPQVQTPVAQPPVPENQPRRGTHPVLKWVGIVVGGLVGLIIIAVLGFFLYGVILGVNEARNAPAAPASYTEEEMTEILFVGDDPQDVRNVAGYIVSENSRPEDVYNLYVVGVKLFDLGNREQALFWFHIAQMRTRAYAEADPDKNGSAASRSAIEAEFGPRILEWGGSDPAAWGRLVERAIAYEKKLPYPVRPEFIASDSEWRALVDTERATYASEFRKAGFSDPVELAAFEAWRKENGLYVGPWQEPGEPLLSEWQ